MISYWEAFVLGVIQGLTEFIPVSSSAHLRIAPALMGWPDFGAAFTAVIQLGTLIALLIYFRRDMINLVTAGYQGLRSGNLFADWDARLAWYLILGTIPISVVGLTFKRFITGDARSLYVVASSLIALAIILQIVDMTSSRKRELRESNWKDFLLVGLGQCLALIPGSSRAGTTLTMGLLLGFSREASMRIAFLLGIPAIGLSGLYELYAERAELARLGFGGVFVGTLVSGIVGYATIAGLLKYLRTHTTLVFVLYRIAAGLTVFYLLYLGVVK